MENRNILVQTTDLTKEFTTLSSSWSKSKGIVHAVTDVNLNVYEGETLGIVGESGCGKSTLGRLILHLLKPTRGEVTFDGQDLSQLKEAELRDMRKQMQMVFQDPYASLNPRLKIRDIVAEPLVTHKITNGKDEDTAIVEDLLRKCGIRPEFMYRYPHQFSGGQRQRVSIARALALNPRLIVCDEPGICAGRIHSISNSELAGRSSGGNEPDLHLYFPRPICSQISVRPGLCHVPRQSLRTGSYTRHLRKPDPSIHQISVGGSSFARSRKAEGGKRYAHWRDSKPGKSAERLLFPNQMPIRDRALRQRNARTERSRTRQIRSLSPDLAFSHSYSI